MTTGINSGRVIGFGKHQHQMIGDLLGMLNSGSSAVPTAAAYKANKSCTETLRLALLSPLSKHRYCSRTEKKKKTHHFFPFKVAFSLCLLPHQASGLPLSQGFCRLNPATSTTGAGCSPPRTSARLRWMEEVLNVRQFAAVQEATNSPSAERSSLRPKGPQRS